MAPKYIGDADLAFGYFFLPRLMSVGKCMGLAYLHGSWVRVPMGTMGNCWNTSDLQNKSKNMFFGPQMNEIQVIL